MLELYLGAITVALIGAVVVFAWALGPNTRNEEESTMLGVGDVVWHDGQWVEITGYTQVNGVTRVRVRAVRHG